MNTENTGCFTIAREWTWKDRLRAKLFPNTPCYVPEAPRHYKDCLSTTVRSHLCFTDRLRVLLTGKAEVEIKIVTENVVGGTRTASVFRSGRFF
jgi:hypothetical protein